MKQLGCELDTRKSRERPCRHVSGVSVCCGMIDVVFSPPCVAAGQRADQARQHVHAAAAAHAVNAGLQHGRRD